MRHLFCLAVALKVKIFSLLLFKTKAHYVNPSADFWSSDVNIFCFLNHTSLFEPILFSALPNSFFFKNIKRTVVPGADITLERPLVGRLYKLLFPQMVSISRKRDDTWIDFMDRVNKGSLVVIAPEGRMMRQDGLDKHGNPMSIKSGIADILKRTHDGYMIVAYSGGLHHVQKPGERFFHPFKTIEITFERINIAEYKEELNWQERGFHRRVVEDLEARIKRHIPKARK